MLTKEDATALVEQLLERESQEAGCDLSVMRNETAEHDFGWVFFYNSKSYIETGDEMEMLAGNAPLIVDKRNGKVHVTGTALPVETYIANYRQFGSPNCPQVP